MNGRQFDRLFAYDGWANRECLRAIQAGAGSSGATASGGTLLGSVVGRMAHILSAERLWLERIRRVPQSMEVWPGSTLEECEALAEEMASAWREYLAKLAANGLEETIGYKNSKGETWRSRVEDVLTHVIMHSAYHRGQIALEMRAAGMEPEISIIRGGTDGSVLTERGLPTPNLSTGQHNPHSPLEWTSLEEMQKAVDVLVQLAIAWGREKTA